MEEFRVKPDVITFSNVMNAWSDAGFGDKSKETFDDMVHTGVKPDAHAYCILAKGYVNAREPEKAEQLLTGMVKSGVRPNKIFFTTLLKGWLNAGRMESAISVFDKMCEVGIYPDLRTFDQLIWGYAEAKQPWKAEEILHRMESFKVQAEKSALKQVAKALKPNAVIYNTLAIAYARNGLTCRAEGMIPEMQNHHVQPNERLCDTIVGGYIKEGKIEEALRFVHRMKDLGVHLELVRFNSLLKVFLDMAYREGVHEVSFLFMFPF